MYFFPFRRHDRLDLMSKWRHSKAKYQKSKRVVGAKKSKVHSLQNERIRQSGNVEASLLDRMERTYLSFGSDGQCLPTAAENLYQSTIRTRSDQPNDVTIRNEQVGKKINDLKVAQTRPKETDTGKKSYRNKNRALTWYHLHSFEIPVKQTITSWGRCTHEKKKIRKSIKPKADPHTAEINKELSWPISKRDWREINDIHLWIDEYEKKQYIRENDRMVEKYRSKQWRNFVKRIKQLTADEPRNSLSVLPKVKFDEIVASRLNTKKI